MKKRNMINNTLLSSDYITKRKEQCLMIILQSSIIQNKTT